MNKSKQNFLKLAKSMESKHIYQRIESIKAEDKCFLRSTIVIWMNLACLKDEGV